MSNNLLKYPVSVNSLLLRWCLVRNHVSWYTSKYNMDSWTQIRDETVKPSRTNVGVTPLGIEHVTFCLWGKSGKDEPTRRTQGLLSPFKCPLPWFSTNNGRLKLFLFLVLYWWLGLRTNFLKVIVVKSFPQSDCGIKSVNTIKSHSTKWRKEAPLRSNYSRVAHLFYTFF